MPNRRFQPLDGQDTDGLNSPFSVQLDAHKSRFSNIRTVSLPQFLQVLINLDRENHGQQPSLLHMMRIYLT